MCNANCRRICVLCMYFCCFTCMESARNDLVSRRPVEPQDIETINDAYYMEKDYFINSLMKEYGDGTAVTYEGLEDLLYHLGVGGIDKLDLDKRVGRDHNHYHGNQEYHDSNDDHTGHDLSHDGLDVKVHTHSTHEDNTQVPSVEETNTTDTETSTLSERDLINDEHNVQRRSVDQNQCLPAATLVKTVKKDVKGILTKAEFKDLCPSLIHQIDTNACYSYSSGNYDDNQNDHYQLEQSKTDPTAISAKVWGYSTISVITISLVGLFGVVLVPVMEKVFYNHLLQFLVALAVGALSGDALLHLIPHAMGSHVHGVQEDGHGHEPHDPSMIYKGFCALMGIYLFFWTERLLTIFTEARGRKKEMKKKAKNHKSNDENGSSRHANQCDGMMMSIHPNQALHDYVLETHGEHCTKDFDDEFVCHRHGPCPNDDIGTAANGEERISMMDDSPKVRHGHGHSHGISGVPKSIASVAWMLIIGDGIHNFSDGLAIGAAFSSSITGGFSTSIAILCHELPHEIGDFALLLRSGMSAKQAIFYTCISSILCFLGMLVGVAVGNVGGASLWIFAAVGGIFIYIGMVDMLPELSAVDTREGEHPLCHLLLQVIGMSLGAGIMLVIALYEHDLMKVLE